MAANPAQSSRSRSSGKPARRRIILFRHAEAIEPSDTVSDAMRVLTPKGLKRAKQSARGLAKLIDAPTTILTSPKLRARQTADVLGKVFDVVPKTMPALAEGSAGQIVQALMQLHHRVLVVVGHEPTLSLVADRLCGREAGESSIEIRKSGCACVDLVRGAAATGPEARPQGRLAWLLTPRLLRRLGR